MNFSIQSAAVFVIHPLLFHLSCLKNRKKSTHLLLDYSGCGPYILDGWGGWNLVVIYFRQIRRCEQTKRWYRDAEILLYSIFPWPNNGSSFMFYPGELEFINVHPGKPTKFSLPYAGANSMMNATLVKPYCPYQYLLSFGPLKINIYFPLILQ